MPSAVIETPLRTPLTQLHLGLSYTLDMWECLFTALRLHQLTCLARGRCLKRVLLTTIALLLNQLPYWLDIRLLQSVSARETSWVLGSYEYRIPGRFSFAFVKS